MKRLFEIVYKKSLECELTTTQSGDKYYKIGDEHFIRPKRPGDTLHKVDNYDENIIDENVDEWLTESYSTAIEDAARVNKFFNTPREEVEKWLKDTKYRHNVEAPDGFEYIHYGFMWGDGKYDHGWYRCEDDATEKAERISEKNGGCYVSLMDISDPDSDDWYFDGEIKKVRW